MSLLRALPVLRVLGVLGALGMLGVLLALTGCAEDDRPDIRGSVRVDGSSTVFPMGEAAAEEFSKVSRVRVNVGFSGTGGGIEKFCRGETDFAQASRHMKPDEAARCQQNGRDELIEISVATDALTVMVHPSNDFASCLTLDELYRVFGLGGMTSWDQLDPSFPGQPIAVYVPGTDSGTFDYFVEAIIEGVGGEDAGHRGDVTASEDDNILVQGLRNDPYSIGYLGFAHFQEAGAQLKALAIDGGEGCVAPSVETVLDGTYQPLARPLLMYTDGSILRENEAALPFLEFYMEHMREFAIEVGYVPLPEAVYEEQLAALDQYRTPPTE